MEAPASIWERLGWLVLIWGASVLSLGVVAGLIHWWLSV
ncbi:DUF2474 family protein [Acetobacter oeni]|nr:DUF2474 family protein [Acetobacter oeni]MBB3884648.1 hypothetical protein [Acetobacter oeni]NHO20589.1 DUF2474 family protein [Acetobacter oeni]